MSRDLYPAALPEKSYQPDKWTSTHRYMVLLEIAGKKPGEIAEILDYDISRVSVILNDPRAELDRIDFSSNLSDRMVDIHTKLEHYAHEALEVIVEEMRFEGNKSELRSKNAFGLLDRAGYGAVQKTLSATAEIPPEVVERMTGVLDDLREIRPKYAVVRPKVLDEEEEWDDG